MDAAVRAALEADVEVTHDRFVAAMQRRLGELEPETLERYFGTMAKLVQRLEDRALPMQRVLAETVSEVGALVMLELQRRS